MADNKVQYEVEIKNIGSGAVEAKKGLEGIDSAAKKSGLSMLGFAKEIKNVALFLAGSAFLRQSINEFVEQERATAKLNLALKDTGQFTPQVAKELKGLASALAEVTEFSGSEIENVIGKLITFGASAKDVDRLAESVLDLATVFDKDLNRATMAMGQALRGEFSAFAGLGFQIRDTLTPMGQFNDLMAQVHAKLGGQARASMDSAIAPLKDLEKAWKDLEANVGESVLAIIGLVNKVGPLLYPHEKSGESATPLPKTVVPSLGTQGMVDTTGLPRFRSAGALTPGGLPLSTQPAAAAPARSGIPLVMHGPDPFSETPEMTRKRMEMASAALEKFTADYEQSESVRTAAAIMYAGQRQQTLARFFDQQKAWQDELTLGGLEGEAKVQAQIEIDHQSRLRSMQEMKFETEEDYDTAIELEARLTEATRSRFQHSLTFAGRMEQSLKAIGKAGEEAFSSGLATAMVDAFEKGGDAFKTFARQFLRTMAQMILQAIILRAIQSGMNAAFGGSGSDTAGASSSEGFSSSGDVATFTQEHSMGARISRVSIPSVLGRSASASSGAVGSAGAGGRVGGAIQVHVSLSPDLKAEVISNSIAGAVSTVTQHLGQNTKLSRAAQSLNT